MWNVASSGMPETRQHLFSIFPDFLFLPVVEPLVLLDARVNGKLFLNFLRKVERVVLNALAKKCGFAA
jgi:hypothetical protein